MINYIGGTEIQLQQQNYWWTDDQQPCKPGAKDEKGADPAAHDGGVMQRLADGQVAVVGHGGQKVKFCHPKQNEKEKLSHTAIIGNSSVSCPNSDKESGNAD